LREVFVWRHINEFSYEEMAEIKGLPVGTIKNRVFQAREYPPPKIRLKNPAMGNFFFRKIMAIPGIKRPSAIISEARPRVFKML
ncbi:unnamed protein product, partial [marine sediment metagenome]